MADIVFNIPAQVYLGLDIINRLGVIVSEIGERVIIVTEAILYEPKVIERVCNLLDKRQIQYIIFDEVVPNATSKAVDDGVMLARGSHADVVIGLGGMKTLSIAKAIAMTAPNDNDIEDFLAGVTPGKPPLGYIEIPTTCRDHFMLTDEYFLVDARDRTGRIGKAQEGITKAVIIDPKLSRSLPKKYTITTMFDTLLAAVEGFLSQKANYLSDTFFTKAIELLGSSIPEVEGSPDEIKVRLNASTAGMLTAMGLSMSKQGIGGALSYAINAKFLVPKSWVATILLPHVMEFNMAASTEKLSVVAGLLGEESTGNASVEEANRAVEAVRRLMGPTGISTRLRDFDLSIDDLIEVAGTARTYDMMNYLPRLVSTEDLYEIIKSAF